MSDKKGIRERLRDMVSEEVPSKGPDSGSDSQPQATVSKPIFGPASQSASRSPGIQLLSKADPAIVASVRAKVDEKSSEGYAKFQELLRDLSPVITDERQRVKAALVSMAKMGFDGSAIAALYNQRVTSLQSFSDDFESAFQRKLDAMTEKTKGEIAELDKKSTTLAQQIADCQAELNEAQRRRSELMTQQEASVSDLTQKGSQTREAIRVVADELTTERDKVSQFIS